MNPNDKKKLLRSIFPIVAIIVREFFKGKTKLGVYILGVTTLSLKFFLDVDPQIAAVKPSIVPVVAKVATYIGSGTLAVGVGHDLIKKSKKIIGGIKDYLKFL